MLADLVRGDFSLLFLLCVGHEDGCGEALLCMRWGQSGEGGCVMGKGLLLAWGGWCPLRGATCAWPLCLRHSL